MKVIDIEVERLGPAGGVVAVVTAKMLVVQVHLRIPVRRPEMDEDFPALGSAGRSNATKCQPGPRSP